ncbi:DUF6515 family protein [Microbulbifer magnicolonia]|uniref:DUF6515 family protein n=1 Tax=Microbulbifer magnicolonia TaxID=3109744 RepID=UPI002B40DCEF|nr:DUF6515 family protein [Microbulbifer sp. GG15]
MKQIITAIATASVLLLAGPALADGRDHYRGKQDSDISGSAFRKAYNKERAQARDDRHDRGGSHRPPKRQDHHGNGRGNGHDKGRGNGHDKGRGNGHDKGRGNGHDRGHYDRDHHKGRDRDHHKGRDRDHHKGRDHDYRKWTGHDHYKRRHHKPRRPYYRPGYHAHKPRWRPAHYHYGYRWRHLPRSFVSISVGTLGFFYSDGIFYRPAAQGYVVAAPPVGAIVHSLPGTAVTVVLGGLDYYVAYDTYYLWDGPRGGYRVVANPGFF